MTLEQLKTFIKVAEVESFSQAGKALHLSQPSISCHILALEEELKTRLFDRLGKRRIVITKPGKSLLKYARRMIGLEMKAKMAIDDLQNLKRGEIRLGTSNIPGAYLLLPTIKKFTTENPRVKISSHISDTQGIVNEVLNGSFDLGVVGKKSKIQQLHYDDLIDDTMVLALPPSHPLAGKSSISIKEFQTLPLLIREEGSGSRDTVEKVLNHEGIDINTLMIVAQLGNTEAIKQGIKAGLGCSLISYCAIVDEVKYGLIKYVSIKELIFKRKFYIVLPKLIFTLPLINYFKDYLLQNISLLNNTSNNSREKVG